MSDPSVFKNAPSANGASPTSPAIGREIVEFLTREGAQPAADLAELWRRNVFSIAIRNTDDHLRNHGFLLTDHG